MRIFEGTPHLPAPPPRIVHSPDGIPAVVPVPVAPFWGEWGVVRRGAHGCVQKCGRVGPFKTIQEAFDAAARAAKAHGATALPGDGWAQVKDSAGQGVGPIT